MNTHYTYFLFFQKINSLLFSLGVWIWLALSYLIKNYILQIAFSHFFSSWAQLQLLFSQNYFTCYLVFEVVCVTEDFDTGTNFSVDWIDWWKFRRSACSFYSVLSVNRKKRLSYLALTFNVICSADLMVIIMGNDSTERYFCWKSVKFPPKPGVFTKGLRKMRHFPSEIRRAVVAFR